MKYLISAGKSLARITLFSLLTAGFLYLIVNQVTELNVEYFNAGRAYEKTQCKSMSTDATQDAESWQTSGFTASVTPISHTTM